MAKVQIKTEKLTLFEEIFLIMEQFDSILSSVIDSTLGLRCSSFGYQHSEIIRSLVSIYLCGSSCIHFYINGCSLQVGRRPPCLVLQHPILLVLF